MINRVAVYGTLKRDWGNHLAISQYDGVHVADTYTAQPFLMQDCGFPMVIWDTADHDNATHIEVEVYDVCDESLRRMDGIEGHPNFYERREIEVQGVDGLVWMYFIPEPRDQLEIIETGRWNPDLNHHRTLRQEEHDDEIS